MLKGRNKVHTDPENPPEKARSETRSTAFVFGLVLGTV